MTRLGAYLVSLCREWGRGASPSVPIEQIVQKERAIMECARLYGVQGRLISRLTYAERELEATRAELAKCIRGTHD